MKKRLREIRKNLKLNQSDFAAKIGIGQGAYSKIETGETALTEQNIKLICLTFGVNETWLRNGEEDMFTSKDLAETPDEKELLSIFGQLSPEMKEFFLNMGRNLVKTKTAQREGEKGVHPIHEQERA
jgi:transcriptional regulator with XRE-family HTH domain